MDRFVRHPPFGMWIQPRQFSVNAHSPSGFNGDGASHANSRADSDAYIDSHCYTGSPSA